MLTLPLSIWASVCLVTELSWYSHPNSISLKTKNIIMIRCQAVFGHDSFCSFTEGGERWRTIIIIQRHTLYSNWPLSLASSACRLGLCWNIVIAAWNRWRACLFVLPIIIIIVLFWLNGWTRRQYQRCCCPLLNVLLLQISAHTYVVCTVIMVSFIFDDVEIIHF